MQFSNAQILAAVVTEWSRPAISQLAVSRLANISTFQSLQQTIKQSGIVGQNYSITSDLMPFMQNGMNILIQPMLEAYFSKVPDEALPQLARSVVDTALQQPRFSILDGFVEFEQSDIVELSNLLEKNLPVQTNINSYQVIK